MNQSHLPTHFGFILVNLLNLCTLQSSVDCKAFTAFIAVINSAFIKGLIVVSDVHSDVYSDVIQ